uniref:Uncharacterized protein n=1 Tax=Engystomops pustulosus TaxID=76066 RepID=A0AAV6YI54_ENGPU|nr:hypothetical protein GDO81_029988 [Engystomops pustulosus]
MPPVYGDGRTVSPRRIEDSPCPWRWWNHLSFRCRGCLLSMVMVEPTLLQVYRMPPVYGDGRTTSPPGAKDAPVCGDGRTTSPPGAKDAPVCGDGRTPSPLVVDNTSCLW